MRTTKDERDQLLAILDRPFHLDNESPAVVAALHAVFADLDEVLRAVECVVDHGALENYDSSEDGIEGIPGYEFRDKWGILSEAQILDRLRDVLPPREP